MLTEINRCVCCDKKLLDIGEKELLMCVSCAKKVNDISLKINKCALSNEYYCNNPKDEPNCYNYCELYFKK